ncbi:hypothetical protein [Winogradskyella damuponensis]|uniref:Uncharacterized protein n=1 Tax=Winogradskyella damuponensis TaxID=943939 RepID=A0ABP8D3F4_9FLAO
MFIGNNIHISDEDFKNLKTVRNSRYIGSKFITKFEFLLFKFELTKLAKIQEKITPENDFKIEFDNALNEFKKSRKKWLESNPETQSS